MEQQPHENNFDAGNADGGHVEKKKSTTPLIVGGALIAIIMIIAIVIIITKSSSKPTAVQYKPSPEELKQLEYDATQEARKKKAEDSIQDKAFIQRESNRADAGDMIKALEAESRTSQFARQSDSNEQITPRESAARARQEEEAINYLLRDSVARAEKEKAASPPPPPSQSTQTTQNSGSVPQMFVYSQTFGGARYTDNKGTSTTSSQQTRGEPSTSNIDDLTRMALGLLETSSPSPQQDTTEPVRSTIEEKKTQLLYTALPPVTVNEGEMLEAVLVNRLLVDTEPSPVVCTLSRDFYDKSGQYVIFPANSRVIGSSQAVSYKGASRLFISFHRIILPNDLSVDLPQSASFMRAMDETGALGIVSHVNRRWFLQFGAAIMLGVIDGIAGWAQGGQQGVTTADGYVISRTSENFDRVLDRVMSQYSSIVPQIRVDQGKTLRVYISDDMLITPYARLVDRSYYGTRPE